MSAISSARSRTCRRSSTIEHLDKVVSDLGATLTALIGSIPGARRALRATATTPAASTT